MKKYGFAIVILSILGCNSNPAGPVGNSPDLWNSDVVEHQCQVRYDADVKHYGDPDDISGRINRNGTDLVVQWIVDGKTRIHRYCSLQMSVDVCTQRTVLIDATPDIWILYPGVGQEIQDGLKIVSGCP